MRELGIITDYAGAVGFVIAFTFPALLYIASKRQINKVPLNKISTTKSHYSGLGSNTPCAFLVSLFGIGMTIFALVCLNGD